MAITHSFTDEELSKMSPQRRCYYKNLQLMTGFEHKSHHSIAAMRDSRGRFLGGVKS